MPDGAPERAAADRSNGGFVPPPYPHDRLAALRRLADAVPGGMVDCSVGSPTDPMPRAVLDALGRAAPTATGYPSAVGSRELRVAAGAWLERRAGVRVDPDQVVACVGAKELVASLPRALHLRNPSRDTVLYPAVAYPTYEMGARLAGLRTWPVPLDDRWHLDLRRVPDAEAERALLLWCNHPANPTGAVISEGQAADVADWARARGVIVASDECYLEFAGAVGTGVTMLAAGDAGILTVHSLSKRSNMAGLRVGFVVGDPDLVRYLGELRRHAGLMVPTPVQAAAVAALDDDEHVAVQLARYGERRRLMLEGLAGHGLVHDGGPAWFYLWLRAADGADDGWEIAARLAEAGTLVAPGDLYGPAGADHVRLALTQPTERLRLALERLAASGPAA